MSYINNDGIIVTKNEYSNDDITPEFIKENLDRHVWLRWDYLAMRGYEKRQHVLEFLDHVASVKGQAEKDGFKYSS